MNLVEALQEAGATHPRMERWRSVYQTWAPTWLVTGQCTDESRLKMRSSSFWPPASAGPPARCAFRQPLSADVRRLANGMRSLAALFAGGSLHRTGCVLACWRPPRETSNHYRRTGPGRRNDCCVRVRIRLRPQRMVFPGEGSARGRCVDSRAPRTPGPHDRSGEARESPWLCCTGVRFAGTWRESGRVHPPLATSSPWMRVRR